MYIIPQYFKELIRDPRTGKLRDATAADKAAQEAPAAARRAAGAAALQRQENLDRAVMRSDAANKKWGLRMGLPKKRGQ